MGKRPGGQPFHDPFGAIPQSVTKAIVQAIGSALPKFNRLRQYAVSSPMRRERNRSALKSLCYCRELGLQRPPVRDHFALRRSPRAELAADGSRMEVIFRFFPRRFFHPAADPDLALELRPENVQRRARVFFNLLSLVALVIREENEPALADRFQQDDPHEGDSVRGRGREAHRIHVADVGRRRFVEPFPKLLDRIRVEVRAAQSVRGGLVPEGGVIRGGNHSCERNGKVRYSATHSRSERCSNSSVRRRSQSSGRTLAEVMMRLRPLPFGEATSRAVSRSRRAQSPRPCRPRPPC